MRKYQVRFLDHRPDSEWMEIINLVIYLFQYDLYVTTHDNGANVYNSNDQKIAILYVIESES